MVSTNPFVTAKHLTKSQLGLRDAWDEINRSNELNFFIIYIQLHF